MLLRPALPFCALLLASCAATSRDDAPAMDTTAMAAEVQARSDGFAAAALSGSVDSMATFLTADFVLLEPGMDTKGKDAFHSLLTELWKIYKVKTLVMAPEARTYAPGIVTVWGRYRETYSDSTNVELACDCVYSSIWRKEADGVWRMARMHAGQPLKAP